MFSTHPFSFSLLCLAVGLLSGCSDAIYRADDAALAKRQMLGLSREDVLTCMGPPKKKTSEGATDVWSYLSTDYSGSSISNRYKITPQYSTTPSSHSRNFCVVNIVIKDGIVKAVNYSGPTGNGFAKDEQCGYAVANCVSSVGVHE